jgi:hypothetical protein
VPILPYLQDLSGRGQALAWKEQSSAVPVAAAVVVVVAAAAAACGLKVNHMQQFKMPASCDNLFLSMIFF